MEISVAQAQLFFLALTRILAITTRIPVIAGPLVPNQVKIGLAALLTMALLPWQPLPVGAESMPAIGFGFALGREFLIGTVAGFAADLTFAAIQIAGEMMGMSSGFNSARILNPALETSGSAMDQFFLMMVMLLFFAFNGHHIVILGIQRTFTLIPLNSPIPELSIERIMHLTGEMITTGLQLSLPVVGALLLADLTLGLLARVAPQIQVFFLGVPIKVAIGLLGMAISFGVLSPTIANMFRMMGERALHLLGG